MTVGCKNTIEFTLPQPFLCPKNISFGPFSVILFKVLRVRRRVFVGDVAIGGQKTLFVLSIASFNNSRGG